MSLNESRNENRLHWLVFTHLCIVFILTKEKLAELDFQTGGKVNLFWLAVMLHDPTWWQHIYQKNVGTVLLYVGLGHNTGCHGGLSVWPLRTSKDKTPCSACMNGGWLVSKSSRPAASTNSTHAAGALCSTSYTLMKWNTKSSEDRASESHCTSNSLKTQLVLWTLATVKTPDNILHIALDQTLVCRSHSNLRLQHYLNPCSAARRPAQKC